MELPIFYNEAEEWSKAILLYDAALKEINTKLEILNNEFKVAHKYNPIEHITSRIKSPESIAKKIRRDGYELTVANIVKYINDVAGIRIICSFTSDIYRIVDTIRNQSDVKILKIKDYIENPKPNGYMSYHMIVSVPIFLTNNVVETKVEIQIRTIAMDFWASLEHKIYYKFEGKAPESIRNDLKECADLVSYLDQKMLRINEEIKKISNETDTEYTTMLSEELQESYGSVIESEKSKEAEPDVVSMDVEKNASLYRDNKNEEKDMISNLNDIIMKNKIIEQGKDYDHETEAFIELNNDNTSDTMSEDDLAKMLITNSGFSLLQQQMQSSNQVSNNMKAPRKFPFGRKDRKQVQTSS